jgi:predicted nuclease of restriction endonuclease-like RecB superfamily
MTKYKAVRSVYDGYSWDSNLELDFYKRLQVATTYVKGSNVQVLVKPSIIVKPECEVFPVSKWKCDFRLSSGKRHINIEIKGFLTRDFAVMFKMFEYTNPHEFKKTYIATDNEDIKKKYAKLGNRLIWLPDKNGNFCNPNNW